MLITIVHITSFTISFILRIYVEFIIYVVCFHFYYPVFIFKTHLIGRASLELNEGASVGSVCPQLYINQDRYTIVPQGDDGGGGGDVDKVLSTGEEISPGEVTQNVQFDETTPGTSDTRGEVMDPLRTSIDRKDVGLEDFFLRPIKVAEYTWNVGGQLFQQFKPWDLFWENSRVINRVANYKLLRCTMKVKIVTNGNSFYYGRSLVSYAPLTALDDVTVIRGGFTEDLVEASQRPHFWINPTTSQGGELVLPFFTGFNALDIPSQEWRDMGEVTISSVGNLKQANGGSTPINVSVFVWAENVELIGLTQQNPADIEPQGGPAGGSKKKKAAKSEHEGILSKPASIVAKTAGMFKSVPVIGGYATATEIGANAIGSMAAMFGFSKPAMEDLPPFQPMTRQSMANCDGRESLLKLTVDLKNELTIDPGIASLDTPDELTINSISNRESFLTQFDWAVGLGSESRLFNIVVDPCVVRQNGTAPPEIHMPACAFATFPFEYWRGTLRYRFQIVRSAYHKGRLKIVYDPFGAAPDTGAEYNTAYTQIVDMDDTDDFCIDVGWGQHTSWRQHLPLVQLPGATFAGAVAAVPATRLTYSSSNAVGNGNGVLSVYVVNELTTPDSTINNDIQVLVSVSACSDFEVASPTSLYLGQMGLRGSSNPNIEPQGAEEDNDVVAVTDPERLTMMGSYTPVDPIVNRIHMGEVVCSFRQLLKRYQLHETLVGSYNTGTLWQQHTRPMFPYTPGYTAAAPAESNLIVDLTTRTPPLLGSYVYARLTLMNYLKGAYGGWRGSIRYTTDTTINPSQINAAATLQGNQESASWMVSRKPVTYPTSKRGPSDDEARFDFAFGDDDLSRSQTMLTNYNLSGLSGISRWSSSVNPIQSYEIPYYSQYRFAPARSETAFNGDDPYQDSYEVVGLTVSNNHPNIAPQYVAAGEDFTFLFYLSPPIVYFQYPPILE